jgi:Concanavalin A-like lectin/glucanases superfamily
MSRNRIVFLSTAAVLVALCLPGAAAAADFPLSAYWPMNEGKGQVVRDWSGHGNNGQLGSTPGVDANDPTWIKGLFSWSYGLHFDGSDFVSIPDSNSLEPQELTVSAWFRGAGSPGAAKYLVAKGSNQCVSASYGLYTATGGGMAFYVGNGLDYGAYTMSPEAPASVWDGKWHNASGTYDGNFVRLFIDGKEVGSGTAGSTPVDYGLPSGNSHLGGYVGSCDLTFSGDLDEVSIWSKALPVADIWKRAALFFAPH